MPANSTETVHLPLSPAGRLCGTVSLTGSVSVVVYVHGFGSDHRGAKAEALRAACSRRDWSFAAFDFRGHGDSSGALLQLRGSGLQEDLRAIQDWLSERGVRWLFLVGSSMGGWASAWFALAHPHEVPAVVLMAPAFRFLQRRWEELDESDQLAWQQTGRRRFLNEWVNVELGFDLVAERDRFDPETLAKEWRTPGLIFHGLRDETVPWRDALALVEQTRFPDLELRLLGGGDHRLQGRAKEMAEEACRFFARWWE
jgi:pimeloyl-ACP methyl ester carboxylesterase